MKDKKVNQSYAIKYCGCTRDEFIKFFPEPEDKLKDPETGGVHYQYSLSNLDIKIPEIRKYKSERNAERMKKDANYKSKALESLMERSNYKEMCEDDLILNLLGCEIKSGLLEAKVKSWNYVTRTKKIDHDIFRFIDTIEELLRFFPFESCEHYELPEVKKFISKINDEDATYDYFRDDVPKKNRGIRNKPITKDDLINDLV